MKPDKDRPSTWVYYRDKLCYSCVASCCTMPVEVTIEDLISMKISSPESLNSPKKEFKRLKNLGLVTSFRMGTGKFMIAQKANSDCYFLDSTTRLCTIYENRPDVCRKFPSIGPRPGYCCYIAKV